jgi:hypothetical protein
MGFLVLYINFSVYLSLVLPTISYDSSAIAIQGFATTKNVPLNSHEYFLPLKMTS